MSRFFFFFFFQATATLSRKKCPEKIVHVAVLSLKVNHTHCNLSAGKKPAWCKRFYVKDYGRKKKVARTEFELPTLSV